MFIFRLPDIESRCVINIKISGSRLRGLQPGYLVHYYIRTGYSVYPCTSHLSLDLTDEDYECRISVHSLLEISVCFLLNRYRICLIPGIRYIPVLPTFLLIYQVYIYQIKNRIIRSPDIRTIPTSVSFNLRIPLI